MKTSSFFLILAAAASFATTPVLGKGAGTPGATVDKNSGVTADPDWIPCIRDPNRDKLKHCSEEYRLCRESGQDSVACLNAEYSTLTPASKPSKDEYTACRAAGHDEVRCAEILNDRKELRRGRER